jgi:ribonuclease R
MKPNERPTPSNLNALLAKIRGGPLEAMLNSMLLRSLKRAEYSADNVGHSGLALDDYLHFTSPIRRYPDLVVHRLMKKILRKELKKETMPQGLKGRLDMLAKSASDCERQATEAERENEKWKSCLLMKNKIGEKFSGTIQGFSMKAAFVRLDSPFVEVGVPLSALGGGFSVDESRTKATGMGGQAILTIGTKALAEITSIDESLHRISAWILEANAQDQNGKIMVFKPTLLGPASLRESDFVAAAMPRGSKARGGGRPPKPKSTRKKPERHLRRGRKG